MNCNAPQTGLRALWVEIIEKSLGYIQGEAVIPHLKVYIKTLFFNEFLKDQNAFFVLDNTAKKIA